MEQIIDCAGTSEDNSLRPFVRLRFSDVNLNLTQTVFAMLWIWYSMPFVPWYSRTSFLCEECINIHSLLIFIRTTQVNARRCICEKQHVCLTYFIIIKLVFPLQYYLKYHNTGVTNQHIAIYIPIVPVSVDIITLQWKNVKLKIVYSTASRSSLTIDLVSSLFTANAICAILVLSKTCNTWVMQSAQRISSAYKIHSWTWLPFICDFVWQRLGNV